MLRDHPTLIPTLHFRETQLLFRNPVVLALAPSSLVTTSILLIGLWMKTGQGSLLWTLLGIASFEGALAALLRLETVVTDRHLTVRFRPFYRRRIPIEQIEESEPLRYNPLGDAGGWGIKSSRKFGRILTAYGDRAVRLVAGDTRMLIGSQRPDELAAAIASAASAALPRNPVR